MAWQFNYERTSKPQFTELNAEQPRLKKTRSGGVRCYALSSIPRFWNGGFIYALEYIWRFAADPKQRNYSIVSLGWLDNGTSSKKSPATTQDKSPSYMNCQASINMT